MRLVSADAALQNAVSLRNLPDGHWRIIHVSGTAVEGPHGFLLFVDLQQPSLGIYELDPSTGLVMKVVNH